MTRHRPIILSTLAVALGVAAALPALAQPAGPRGGPRDAGGIFRQADADNDGRVTPEEGWNAVTARFAQADANRDGGVSWDEFRAYVRSQRGDRPAPEGRRAERMEARGQAMFRALDADRDGRVTQAELRPAAEAMFRMRDRNNDGVLERDEIRPRPARAERPAPPAPAATQAR